MSVLEREVPVAGPWSLSTSRRFWEGFTPGRLAEQRGDALTATFLGEADWRPVRVEIRQVDASAHLRLEGDGDLDAAARQVARFMATDVDGTGWPDVGRRDPVIGAAQVELPGFRPCGFFSPYEAAVWSVLSQRIRMVQAAALARRITADHGEGGAFPAPATLRGVDLGLPGRKGEYLVAVCDAALDGLLDGAALRAVDAEDAIAAVQHVKGLGPFAAGLVVIRGANHPDGLPLQEPRLDAEVERRYGTGKRLADVAAAWRPYRTWACVHLRALAGGSGSDA